VRLEVPERRVHAPLPQPETTSGALANPLDQLQAVARSRKEDLEQGGLGAQEVFHEDERIFSIREKFKLDPAGATAVRVALAGIR
jgi:hypothetical protein